MRCGYLSHIVPGGLLFVFVTYEELLRDRCFVDFVLLPSRTRTRTDFAVADDYAVRNAVERGPLFQFAVLE